MRIGKASGNRVSTRDDILREAARQLAHAGSDGFALSRVAEAVGIRPASVFHHFPGGKADLEQAITDLAVEHGLVTEYTSMIVLQKERYKELGIKRFNQERVEKEQLARQQRAVNTVRNNRVDNSQPMYGNQRPSHNNGGGAFGPWMMLLLLPLVARRLFAARSAC